QSCRRCARQVLRRPLLMAATGLFAACISRCLHAVFLGPWPAATSGSSEGSLRGRKTTQLSDVAAAAPLGSSAATFATAQSLALLALTAATATAGVLGKRWSPGKREGVRAGRTSLQASWEPGRFAKTVAFFKGNPWKLLLPGFLQDGDAKVPAPAAARGAASSATQAVIIDWGASDKLPIAEAWGPLDDVVMGGVSSSSLSVRGEGERRRLTFTGRTSRANNGGFCSFRSRLFNPPLNLKDFSGLVFTARCKDGLRYKIQLRDNNEWDSLGWAAAFDLAPGEEVEVRIPFGTLTPNFRSQIQKDAPPFRPDSISSIQLVLSAFEFEKRLNPRFKEGDFQLELGPISAYRE
ncbi:unnamed protein product, partial [Polarella glacialis]